MASLFENPGAEMSVIGLILTQEVYWKLVPQIQEQDLSVPEYRLILRAMKRLQAEKRPIDMVTVESELRSVAPAEQLGGATAAMMEAAGSSFLAEYHVKEHLRLIREAALRRRMLAALDASRRLLVETEEDTASVLDRTRQSLRDLVTTGHAWESISDVLVSALNTLEKRAKGEDENMPSGICTLDRKTMGFHKGELTIVGARPAVGKSAFGAQIAMTAAVHGFKVGICSREMTDTQYGMRILAREAGVAGGRLRSGKLDGEEWQAVAKAAGEVSVLPVCFLFTARYIEDLRMEVQKKVDEGELDLLVVDYTQLMQAKHGFDKDYLRIGYVSKMLKDMTTDFHIAVVALAQVARSSENEMPTLADLRGSGDLEQDADNVIFLHRPKNASDKYVHPDDREFFDRLKDTGLQYIVVDLAKQRQGGIGTTAVIFDPARQLYTAIERE